MHIGLVSLIVLGSLVAAVIAGRLLRGLLPEQHLKADTKDTVKLATGLIATMFALLVIFLSFSMLAPPNATATGALLVSALSVSGAILLILELDRPFAGLIRISSQPLVNALNHLAK